MSPLAFILAALAAAVPAPGQTPPAGEAPRATHPPLPASSLLGSGLLTLPDTRTMPRGRVNVATTLHNRDRDPLGLDVFDYSLAVTVGITPHIEAYGRGVFSRVVVLPDFSHTWPALPPPPLDLVMPDGTRPPARPYYAMAPAFPFINGRGDQRFSDLVPGDLIAGAKWRVRDGGAGRTAIAVAGEITLPLTRRMGALQSGSSTGGVDLTARGVVERRFAGFDVLASGAFTYVGRPPHADRLLTANAEGSAVLEEPLSLPSRFELGGGLRRPLTPRIAAVAEMIATFEVYGAKTLDRISPLDLLVGAQSRVGRAAITAGLLYAGGSPPSGVVRPSPLAGFVDLSKADLSDAAAYLEGGGLAGAVPYLREGAQLVTPRRPGVPLPEGARVIPDTYSIVSVHQIGFVLVLGWAF
jgi:hypothetical protein